MDTHDGYTMVIQGEIHETTTVTRRQHEDYMAATQWLRRLCDAMVKQRSHGVQATMVTRGFLNDYAAV